jgi:hypothetical protein
VTSPRRSRSGATRSSWPRTSPTSGLWSGSAIDWRRAGRSSTWRAAATRGDPAFVIQRALGQRKRLGFVRNQISYVDDRVVQYLTDTSVGSSGSPVLDRHGRLIAVHSCRPTSAVVRQRKGRVVVQAGDG